MSPITTAIPRAQYDDAFAAERQRAYPMIDELETRSGYVLDRAVLEAVARVLACPVKVHAPNWQHGRVLYAVVRKYLEAWGDPNRAVLPPVLMLDIGSAKGFSAWCLQRVLMDATAQGKVVSLDVIDPKERRYRNSVADCDGPTTLRELQHPWPEMWAIEFLQSTGIDWLHHHRERVHVAFIDGKHEGSIVFREGKLIAERQQPGDLVIFDDANLPQLSHPVNILGQHYYKLEYVRVLPERAYAIGVRR